MSKSVGVIIDAVAVTPGDIDARAIIDRFAAKITSRTRVHSFAHVLSSAGVRMPVAELSALARSHGCIAVVAQA